MLVWPACAEASAGKPASFVNTVAGLPIKTGVAQARDGKLKYARSGANPLSGQQKVHPLITQDDFFVFLKSRLKKLDAVVITGGEPTLQRDLPEFAKKIKALGFLVKLDTNGTNPAMLELLIREGLIDYWAMDLKAPLDKYQAVVGAAADLKKIQESVKIVMANGLPYEFRTTVVPELIDRNDIAAMGKIIKGAALWYLQNFQSRVDLVDEALKGRVPYNTRQMNEMAEIGRRYVERCEVR